MINTTKLTILITSLYFTNLAYSGPCFTDLGSCDTNEKIVTVTPTQSGGGFCTIFVNEKNEKEKKCYYQPTQKIKNEREEQLAAKKTIPATGINLIYSTTASSYNYESSYIYPRENDNSFSNNDNSNYTPIYYDREREHHHQHHHRPGWNRPDPEPNPGSSSSGSSSSGVTIVRESSRSNVHYSSPAATPNASEANSSHGSGGGRHSGRGNNSKGSTKSGSITIRR